CTSCVGVGGCGYCLSTLQCVDGTSSGPSDGSPCPTWISEPDVCPETPRCGEYPECTTCAEDEDCAWCASEGACVTVSEIFSTDCRGTVFDLPCPTSFVA
ncbi:unnamed protein product, partial [Ectocarpus sp. 8 AP-2014]